MLQPASPRGPTLLLTVRACGPCIVSVSFFPCTHSDTIIGFVNSIKTVDGGTHIDGTKAALTRTSEQP